MAEGAFKSSFSFTIGGKMSKLVAIYLVIGLIYSAYTLIKNMSIEEYYEIPFYQRLIVIFTDIIFWPYFIYKDITAED